MRCVTSRNRGGLFLPHQYKFGFLTALALKGAVVEVHITH